MRARPGIKDASRRTGSYGAKIHFIERNVGSGTHQEGIASSFLLECLRERNVSTDGRGLSRLEQSTRSGGLARCH